MSQPLLDFDKVRERLDAFAFGRLFIEELGWSNPPAGRPEPQIICSLGLRAK